MTSDPAPGHAPPVTAAKRVLVVDDNQDAAELLADVARGHGYEVVVVYDPAAALALVPTFSPQLAVLDIGLPQMDGYELAARMRALCPDCRLIALTGYGQDQDRQRSIDAGFHAHMVKPVSVEVFLQLLAGE